MGEARRAPMTAGRLARAGLGVAVIWLTVFAFSTANPVDLTIALLVVLAEVLAVAVVTGPVLAMLSALGAVVLLNWYLVPPYGTFQIASTENVVSLVVFTLVAVVAATLMDLGGRARARAIEASRRTELLSDVLAVGDEDHPEVALQRVREGLGLDYAELRGARGAASDVVLAASGQPTGAVSIDVPLADGYRLCGHGNEVLAPDPDFLVSLGTAAVRAFEAEQLRTETERAEELAAIDRARTALLASVGHDLRTPIASLRVSVDALRTPGPHLTEDDRAALLATLSTSIDRLDDLITNLLDMSRLEAGAVLAHLVPTDVHDVVDRVELATASDRLIVDLPRHLPTATADPALLERVIANLVSNALRHSPAGSPVEIRATADPTSIQLVVADRGPGLPEADAVDVFTPFHRVGAQPDGGSGLGLAIVRGFAEAMAIDVRLGARAGGGLEACVTMPAAGVVR